MTFSIDLSKLKHKQPEPINIIPTVPGRAVHVDADFLAYQVSYDDEKTFSEMKSNCDAIIEKMKLMSGSETAVLHLTPSGSNKGGRYDIALLKEYQANRAGKAKPKFLHMMREWMHKERAGILYMDCEADDGMSMAQYKAMAEGTPELSVIATKDKDLCMVPGLQLNWDSGELTDTEDDFGWIKLNVSDNAAKTKKIKGRGWKFFWAQMLTGDSADNISGLPKVCDLKYCPTGKFKPCGPVLAFDILNPIKTNKQAFKVVRDLYKICGERQGFVDYRTQDTVDFGTAFLSEAKLLWMRRKPDYNDAMHWMKEHCV